MARFNTRGHQAKPAVATVTSPMGTTSRTVHDTRTFEGGQGWKKDAKTDLFLRASASFTDGSDKFYESGYQRDETLRQLARQVAVEDSEWFARFVEWLRRVANIRTAALMVAADGVKARLDAGMEGFAGMRVPSPDDEVRRVPSNRSIIDSVLYRADDPGELLAYWVSEYGEQPQRVKDGIAPSPRIPKPVKRGVADAVQRLYNERSLLKYDTASHAVRFGDVLNLCHVTTRLANVTVDAAESISIRDVGPCPSPGKRQFHNKRSAASHVQFMTRIKANVPLRPYACVCTWWHVTRKPDGVRAMGERTTPVRHVPVNKQAMLFKFTLDRQYGNVVGIPESLRVLRANAALREDTRLESWLNPEFLRDAGMTWEDALSAVGSKVDKAKLWEAMIPSMGYMALLRNLRNFDEAGISNAVAQQVIAKLQDPDEVAKSRQLPFRFYSAYKNVTSLRWGHALETALDLCLPNLPELPGRTLVLTDTSGSMTSLMSQRSSLQCLEAAALFASALAQRNAGRTKLYQYADYPAKIVVPKGGSVLRMVDAIRRHANTVGWGTNIAESVRQTYQGHDRVVIFSDGQGTRGTSARGVGGSVPENVPVYLFNIEGYSASPMPTGSAARFDLGGLSDQTFKLIPLLEAGRDGVWPWEV